MDLLDIRTKGIIRNIRANREIDDSIDLCFFFSGLKFFDFLLEQFEIKTHSHITGFPRLSDSEHIPHSTDFHIPQSNLKTSSEMCMICYRHQSLTCIILELPSRASGCELVEHWLPIEEVANSLDLPASHPSSELVELRQSEILRFVDDDGIGV